MFHVLEITQFPICPLGVHRGLERSGQLLQCHFDPVICVEGRAKSTEVCGNMLVCITVSMEGGTDGGMVQGMCVR